MIVFDLKCAHSHVFEAWFKSSAAYEEQRAGAMIACPVCGISDVAKAVMAPYVGAKGNRSGAPVAVAPEEAPPEALKAALGAMAEVQAKMLEGSEYVGMAFADRARAMHDGAEPNALIHGQATAQQARDLIEDGVSVAMLPLPVVPPEARN